MGEVVVRPADRRELQVRRSRNDGWTEAKRAAFLDHLAATANIDLSCKAVAMDPSGVFRLRRREADFAEQWDAALDTAKARLRAMLIERSMGGGAAAAPGEGEGAPDAPPPLPPAPDPRAMDTALALTVLRLHQEPIAQKRGGAHMRRATKEETDAAIVRKLKALRKRLERR